MSDDHWLGGVLIGVPVTVGIGLAIMYRYNQGLLAWSAVFILLPFLIIGFAVGCHQGCKIYNQDRRRG